MAFEKVEVPVKVLASVPDWVYPPFVVIPEIPVKTPVVEISQSPVLMAKVPTPPPMVIASAPVPPVPMLIVSAPVPVPKLMILVTESVVPKFKVVVAPPKDNVVTVVLKIVPVVVVDKISAEVAPLTVRSPVTATSPPVGAIVKSPPESTVKLEYTVPSV